MRKNRLKDTNLDNLTHTEEIKKPLRAKLRFPNTGEPEDKRQPKHNHIKTRGGAKNIAVFRPPLRQRPPYAGGLSLWLKCKQHIGQSARTHAKRARACKLKISAVENLSFQHFQQVFNKKLHKEFRHYDEHSTIQQVFNKTFNRQKGNK